MKTRSRIVVFMLIAGLIFSLIGSTGTTISKKINLGLDLQGGFEILYEVTPVQKDEKVTPQLLESTVQTLNDRVNRLGISEANIDIEGSDRIRVQLAGVTNQEEAREMLATSAHLSFRDVNDTELLSGADIKEGSAKQDYDQDTGQPIVTLGLKDREKFHQVTSQVANMAPEEPNLLVIWLDYNEETDSFYEENDKKNPKFVSSPSVNKPIDSSEVQINGPDFTVESAQNLAAILNAGSLPVHMDELYSTTVGAQFGEQALEKTIFAGAIGVGLVFLFMIVFYRLPGIVAVVNLSLYIYLILLVFELMNGVLTLPGIAALILGVGMAVDANVITFERIKEELRTGRSIPSAFNEGTKNSLRTILDANITTLLAAGILFVFGTSSVKGFATMLIASVLISFITAVFGTRYLLKLWIHVKAFKKNPGWFGIKKSEINKLDEDLPATFLGKERDILKHQKKLFTMSSILIIMGIISLILFKLNPGVDFTSGSRIDLIANEKLEAIDIENEIDQLGLHPKSIVISGEKENEAAIRFDTVLNKEQIYEINAYSEDNYGLTPSVSVVSPIVGKELVKNAFIAVGLALIGMIVYVSFRFEWYFASTAILTLIHNVFLTLAVFSVLQLEFDITIVAAILTIIGYTINDTIVIFDRIRENIKVEKKVNNFNQLKGIVNKSIVQSLTRSLNTSITTLFTVIVFMFYGAESIQGFAQAMAIGLVVGAYSSLFIAAPLWLVWRGKSIQEKPIVHKKKKRIEGPQV